MAEINPRTDFQNLNYCSFLPMEAISTDGFILKNEKFNIELIRSSRKMLAVQVNADGKIIAHAKNELKMTKKCPTILSGIS